MDGSPPLPHTPDLSGIIDMISKNPEIVNAAKELLTQTGTETPKKESVTVSADAHDTGVPDVSALLPVIQSLKRDTHGAGDVRTNRDALLCALRPYLSPERQSALDRLLTFEKLGSVLTQLNIK